MTEPLDVSLRVRLAYEAGGAAKAAVGDIEAIRAGAARMGQAGAGKLASDLAGVAAPAAAARRDVAAVAAEVAKLGQAAAGTAAAAGLRDVAAEAKTATRAMAEAATAAGRLAGASGPVDWGPRRGAAQDWAAYWAARQGTAGKPKAADWVAAGAPSKEARAEVERVATAAAKLGTAGAGAGQLAKGVGAVAPAAVEARREIDDVGRAAVRAGHDLEQMGRAHRAAGGGDAGGAGGAGGSHGGPGGLRGALIAGARPLHMERLVMSAFTPVGLAGLGAGLGLEKVVHGLADAEGKAIELEAAMAEVRQSLGSMPDAGVKAIEGSILSTSRATGVAAGDLAKITAAAAAAGRPVAELSEFMELGAKAAGGFGARAGEVSEDLTRIGAQFALDQRGLQGTADAVALLQERTGARGAGTLDFVAKTGDVGRLAGLSPQQIAAYGAGMGQMGMGADDAASTFTGLLQKLQTAPQQGEQFQLGLSRLAGPDGRGESAYGLRNLARLDPSAAMLRMLDDIKQLKPMEREGVLTRMFGAEDGEKLARMADHVGVLRRNLGLMDDTAARSGATERVFRIFDETTSAKIDRATAAIGAFSAKVGQAMAPAIGAAADATARLFNSMGNVLDASERASRAVEILDSKRAGQPLTDDQRAAIAADPKLKAMVGDPDAKVPALPPSLAPNPPVPRSGVQPELTSREVAEARARAREQIEGRLRELEGQKSAGAGGPDIGRQIEGARRRLDQFDRAAAPPRPDKHASLVDGGLFRPASYVEGDGLGRTSGGSASEALQAAVEAGTKAGVVAGLREVLDMRGGRAAAGGLVDASWDGGDDAGQSVSGAAGAASRRSLRYGGGYGPHGRVDPDGSVHHRSVRYARGYGPVQGDAAGAGVSARRHGRAGSGESVPDATYQTKGNQIDGLTEEGTRQYAAVLGKRESGNRYGITNPYGYVGRWQMGADALAENGYVKRGTTNRGLNDPSNWTGKGDVHSVEEFKANKGGVQDREFAEYTNRHYAQLKRAGVIKDGMSQADVAGWLAAAHLKGVGGATQLSRGHDNVDANGTSASSYRRMMAGVGSGAPSPGLAARAQGLIEEDRATRARRPLAPSEALSPRFSDPSRLKPRAQPGDITADAGGRGRGAASQPPAIQHFYGTGTPEQTARFAMLEQNREIRRTQGRALHGIGRVA